jgi:hypothetical protein
VVPRRSLRTVLAALVATAALVACGGGSSDDPDAAKAKVQAIEQLQDFGLTEAQATCMVDEIGFETVNEAADLNALTESQQYQQAAADCTQ